MQFYEELGVPRDASPETIKESYRTMVRLLHPDQQTDPAVKQAAERQMRRLNHVYAVLSNPERRRRYDYGALEGTRPPIIIQTPHPAGPRLADSLHRMLWPTLALVCVGVVIWLVTHDEAAASHEPYAATQTIPESSPAGASVQNTPDESPTSVIELRAQLRRMTAERDRAQAQLAQVDPSRASVAAVPPVSLVVSSAFPSVARPVQPQPNTAQRESQSRFAGAWFYTASGVPSLNPALYPPIFIETTISGYEGALQGRYRARYSIPDHAISPDVSFRFKGEPEGANATLVWNGPGRSRGLIHLKLLSSNAMEVRWSASQRGNMGLTSGTAILKRRPE